MDHSEKEVRTDDETEYEDEEVDPRIQGELEKLNQSTDDINRCETELEIQRQRSGQIDQFKWRQTVTATTRNVLNKVLGLRLKKDLFQTVKKQKKMDTASQRRKSTAFLSPQLKQLHN